MYRSDEQRRAMFAAMQQQRSGSPVRNFRSKARRFYQKHPLLAEAAIAIPVVAAGLFGASRIRAIPRVAGHFARLGKGGKLSKARRFAEGIGLEFGIFGAADVAARSIAFGKEQPKMKVGHALAAGLGTEASIRTGLPFAQRALGRYAIGGFVAGRALKSLRRWPYRTR